MVNSILEQLLERATPKVDAAEVYFLSSQDTPIQFENNRLKSLQTKAKQGVALRVISNGKLGFASSTDLTRLDDLIEAAIQTAEIADPVEFEFAKNYHHSTPKTSYTFPTTQELVELGQSLIEQVHNYNSEILVNVDFEIETEFIQIATTDDVFAEQSHQILSGSLGGNLVRGEDFLEIYTYDIAGDRPLDSEKLLSDLIQKYQLAEQKATISSGSFPVLFTPRAVAMVLGRLFKTVLSGQAVVQKSSPLSDKLGQTLFDSRLTLLEDPQLGPNACDFDDEGTPTTRKTLIDKGTVQGFYWDRQWAVRGQVEPTGNGFRGGLSRPGPSLANLCMSPGSTSTEDLIASMDEGIIVDQVLGGRSVQPVGGRIFGQFGFGL
ncbi:TldD/PmbA family protein [Capilliphycus salinus ALCB114379]|uniref:TldD/PmbA family protein n=1 Tax=Capilliphycus salinus TaxID=2768948 RepID=UPI0039A5C1E7